MKPPIPSTVYREDPPIWMTELLKEMIKDVAYGTIHVSCPRGQCRFINGLSPTRKWPYLLGYQFHHISAWPCWSGQLMFGPKKPKRPCEIPTQSTPLKLTLWACTHKTWFVDIIINKATECQCTWKHFIITANNCMAKMILRQTLVSTLFVPGWSL